MPTSRSVKPDHPQAFEAQAWIAAWEAGEAWANSLQAGDEFRGSHGEARAHGLTEAQVSAFGSAALGVIRSWSAVYCERDSLIITRIDR